LGRGDGTRGAHGDRRFNPARRVHGGAGLRVRAPIPPSPSAPAPERLAAGGRLRAGCAALRPFPRGRPGGRLVPVSQPDAPPGRRAPDRGLPAPVRSGPDMPLARISSLTYWYPGAREP